MSLAEEWDEWAGKWCDTRNRTPPSSYWQGRLREAFYAGAEATLPYLQIGLKASVEIKAEIDHFRSK